MPPGTNCVTQLDQSEACPGILYADTGGGGGSLFTVDLSCEGGQGPSPLPLRSVQEKMAQVYQRRGALASVWGWGACPLLLPCSLEQTEAPVRLDSVPWLPVLAQLPRGYLSTPGLGPSCQAAPPGSRSLWNPTTLSLSGREPRQR